MKNTAVALGVSVAILSIIFASSYFIKYGIYQKNHNYISSYKSAPPDSAETKPPNIPRNNVEIDKRSCSDSILGGSYECDSSGTVYFSDAMDAYPVLDAHGERFRQLADEKGRYVTYGSDGYSVYFGPKKIAGANPATFRKINFDDLYDADDEHVFYQGMGYNENLVHGIDRATFVPIRTLDGSPTIYAIDKNFVYCEGNVMQQADVNTFKVRSIGSALDDNHQYDGCAVYDPSNP